MTDPVVGTVVGHYEVLGKLGGGGMGIVYKARDTRLGRLVALKFLPSQWSHDEDAKKRFIREAQAASATEHPAICTIHSIDEAPDGQLFIVMACYEGVTLKQRLEQGPLAVGEALEIATQVAQGLARAHRAGVVHRDIKPSNLILTDDAVKIVDFGLAKFADALHLTVTAAPVGTFAYMSPEQARAEEATAQSDVWATGVVLYEMLTGRLPFQGNYFEAVAHAIRHEDPPSIRTQRPDVPEAVERLVFRALHKDPAVRFASGKELAMALLHVRGLTAPADLRSAVVEAPAHVVGRTLTRPPARRLTVAIAAALVVAAVGAVVFWRSTAATGPRQPISVVPVVNQTGYQELSPYRLALTYVLIQELGESANVRPLDYGRLLQLVWPATAAGADVSSRELQRALSKQARARWTVVPTLLHENGAWRARAEIQDAATGSIVAVLDTDAVASSLTRDAAYSRIIALASLIERHFADVTGGRVPPARPAAARLRTLDAAQALASGLTAMELLEYGGAREAFARASMLDGQHPLPHAWLSRIEQLLRHANAAGEAADRAARLITDETPASDALLSRAMWAAARQDMKGAEASYRQLAERWPDEPRWQGELAAFYERQGRLDDAIAVYQRVRASEDGLAKFDVELCRLFARRDDLPRAREHARLALTQYQETGFRSGQAQALLCGADILRQGSADDKQRALVDSFDALGIFETLSQPFNAARAHNYVALALANQGREAEAVQAWERALAGARTTANSALEAGVLLNLGVASEALGRHRQRLNYYEQSIALNETLGDERTAARAQADAAAVLVEYGPSPEDGARRVQGALTVFRKLGDRSFEVLGLRVLGAYHREAGRTREAEVSFEQALAIALERGLEDDAIGVRLDIGRNRLSRGQYAAAREMLDAVARERRSRDSTHATILSGVASARLGDVGAAEAAFDLASRQITEGGAASLRPLLLVSRGELALERGEVARARRLFDEAAEVPPGELADASAVAASAYRAYLTAKGRGVAAGRHALIEARARAAAMKRVWLEGLCRYLLGRLSLDAGDARGALEFVGGERDVIGGMDPESAARLYGVRGEALRRLGDAPGAAAARSEVRRLVEALRQEVPEPGRPMFSARPAIAVLAKLGAA